VDDEALGRVVGKLAELLYVVYRVINSSKKINVKVFKHVCHMIGILVVNKLPWVHMNQTMHSVSTII
jgi:hypothetical protein